MNPITRSAVEQPKKYFWLSGLLSLALILFVAVPSLFPSVAQFLAPLKIDTDPENMLAQDEPVRVFHNNMKRTFDLHDLIIVGVVNEAGPEGVFTPDILRDVHDLAGFAKTIQWDGENASAGVIGIDIIAPSTVDSIEQAGLGAVRFEWLMPQAPQTQEDATSVRVKAQRIPMLNNTIVSGDGQAIALYIPITSKDVSYQVAQQLRTRIAGYKNFATFHITGLPIAQDQFGIEMFKQMAISAPAAMVLIFILMWVFFHDSDLRNAHCGS
jgi:predicted RND superfamily exporter protein